MQACCANDCHVATPALAERARREAIYKGEKFSDHAPTTRRSRSTTTACSDTLQPVCAAPFANNGKADSSLAGQGRAKW